MAKITLSVKNREVTGRKVSSIRRQGFVPGVVYGHNFKPINIQIPVKDFQKVYSEAGESTLVYLEVGGQEYPTIIHEIARDPISDKYLHADFYKVSLDEKIEAMIQLNFVGEAPAVKSMGGILVKNLSEIEVEGFPQDLPNKIEVDISKMTDFRSQILIKDLPVSSKISIKARPEEIVVLIQEPISEEELKAQLETPAGAVPEEVEVIKKEKPEEELTEEIPKEPAPEKNK